MIYFKCPAIEIASLQKGKWPGGARWHKQLLIGAGSVQGKPIRNGTQGAMSSTPKAGTQNGITFKCFLCLIYGQAIPIPIPGGW